MRKLCVVVSAAFAAAVCWGVEDHADGIVARVLENVEKIRAASPQSVPMAFWDFDGTIIRGDISEGVEVVDGRVVRLYKGLVERTIESGLNSVYPAKGGWAQYRDRDYPRMNEIGPWLAWTFNAQMYHGQSAAAIDAFCEAECERLYRKWFFASSVKMWKALEKAGVENYVVSASPEIFVRSAAKSLGVPQWRIRGIRVVIDGDRITTRVVHPVPYADGKVENVRELVLARPNGVAVAAFGNSYSTDGAFLRHVATQPSLPGGAKGTAVMINGGKTLPGYTEHFITVSQSDTVGDAR
ncbi:MAG: haloacid dehalogenase-like hydrolase [Kiritimatiellae bacterium]|nr:haloacid dehalogenase-like hydrolase [Kiritimatiellia bacterium]